MAHTLDGRAGGSAASDAGFGFLFLCLALRRDPKNLDRKAVDVVGGGESSSAVTFLFRFSSLSLLILRRSFRLPGLASDGSAAVESAGTDSSWEKGEIRLIPAGGLLVTADGDYRMIDVLFASGIEEALGGGRLLFGPPPKDGHFVLEFLFHARLAPRQFAHRSGGSDWRGLLRILCNSGHQLVLLLHSPWQGEGARLYHHQVGRRSHPAGPFRFLRRRQQHLFRRNFALVRLWWEKQFWAFSSLLFSVLKSKPEPTAVDGLSRDEHDGPARDFSWAGWISCDGRRCDSVETTTILLRLLLHTKQSGKKKKKKWTKLPYTLRKERITTDIGRRRGGG